MAKKPGPSYAGLSLDAPPPPSPPEPEQIELEKAIAAAAPPIPPTPRTATRRKVTRDEAPGKAEKGQPYVTYMHSRGHRALRLYALESGSSVQAIIMEALEAWAKKHGITEPIRPERTK